MPRGRKKNPIDLLTPRKRAYLAARNSGKNVKDSAEEAGISKRQGSKYENSEDVQKAFVFLMRKAIPVKKMVNLIAGGAQATMPQYDSKGRKLKERPDWKTRKSYIEMAREDAGYVEKKSEGGGGTMIQVTVQHIGQQANVVQSKPIIQATAQTISASRPVQQLNS